VNLEKHCEAVIEQVWRCTWTLTSSTFGDTLDGHHESQLEKFFETHQQNVF